ncbi:MAG: hypothetical protein ACYDG2_03740 [Ruminiclostridium sp.]
MESLFTTSQNAIEKSAMQQEREAFCDYIKNLNQEQIESIEPLFYRKVLTESESQKLLIISVMMLLLNFSKQ